MLIRFVSLALVLVLAGCASKQPAIKDSANLLGPDGQPVAAPLPEGFEDAFRNGLALLEDERYDDALTHWQGMTEQYAQFPGVWVNLGLTHHRLDDDENALLAYEKARSVDVNFCPVYALEGVSHRIVGQFAEAEASYLAAIDCEPGNGEHYYNMGILLDLYRNDLTGALGYYRKARRLFAETAPAAADVDGAADNDGEAENDGEANPLDIWIVDLSRRAGVDEADPEEIEAWWQTLQAAKRDAQAKAQAAKLAAQGAELGSQPVLEAEVSPEGLQDLQQENSEETQQELQRDQNGSSTEVDARTEAAVEGVSGDDLQGNAAESEADSVDDAATVDNGEDTQP